MGNTNSTNDESQLLKVMKKITKLINNMSWKDMESLEDPEKCNKIIVLASDIFSNHLTDSFITCLILLIKRVFFTLKTIIFNFLINKFIITHL